MDEKSDVDKLIVNLAPKLSGVMETIQRAAGRLDEAIERSSREAERHARGLKNGTWALVAATVVLALATAALVFVEASKHEPPQAKVDAK